MQEGSELMGKLSHLLERLTNILNRTRRHFGITGIALHGHFDPQLENLYRNQADEGVFNVFSKQPSGHHTHNDGTHAICSTTHMQDV